MSRWAVILAGGVGSRFWPVSTPHRPKQLLALAGDEPLLADSAARLRPLVAPERTLVLTSPRLAAAVRALLPDIGDENVIAEPRAAGTGPALAWAAVEVMRRDGPDAVMLCVHADWAIGDPEGFRTTLASAGETAAREHALVTVGVVPTRADPGFGYIQPGPAVAGTAGADGAAVTDGARTVCRFVEKPDRENAARMVRDGFLWNSGIFAWRAGDLLDEMRHRTPEIAGALPLAERGEMVAFFDAVQPVSIDQGVLERSERVLVLPGDFRWDDVGTWAALARVRRTDAAGNAIAGDVHTVASRGNVVHAEGETVVLFGVEGLVVVSQGGLTLVTTMERAADLKTLIDQLPPAVRERG